MFSGLLGLSTQLSGPSLSQSQRESLLAARMQEPPVARAVNLSQNFGSVPFPMDPGDTRAQAKAELINDDAVRAQYLQSGNYQVGRKGKVTPLPVIVTAPITDSDVAHYERKRAADEHFAYTQYTASKFDLRDPAEAELYRRLHPEYYDKQAEYINSRIDTVRRWLSIRANGIQSAEDDAFLWMLDTKRISLPAGYASFQELATPAEMDDTGALVTRPGPDEVLNGAERGIMNPLRWFAPTRASYPTDKFGWREDGDRGLPPNRHGDMTVGVYSAPDGIAQFQDHIFGRYT